VCYLIRLFDLDLDLNLFQVILSGAGSESGVSLANLLLLDWILFSEVSEVCLGVPGKIIEITDSEELTRSGRVDFEGLRREVNLALVPEAGENDYVIVHAGIAISVVDEQEARKVFEYLHTLEEEIPLPVAEEGDV
jgi:hydrogenase expression/formation protein HypC